MTESSLALAVIVIAITIALESLANFDSLFSVFVVAVAVAAGLLFYLSTESLVWCIGFGLGTAETPTPSPPWQQSPSSPCPPSAHPNKNNNAADAACNYWGMNMQFMYLCMCVYECIYLRTMKYNNSSNKRLYFWYKIHYTPHSTLSIHGKPNQTKHTYSSDVYVCMYIAPKILPITYRPPPTAHF